MSKKRILPLYDADFTQIGAIDKYDSLRWRKNYQGVGEFEIKGAYEKDLAEKIMQAKYIGHRLPDRSLPDLTIKTDLIAYHDLVSNANDQHGSHHGTINGTVPIDSDGAYFNGTEGNNIQLPQTIDQALYGSTQLAISFWCRLHGSYLEGRRNIMLLDGGAGSGKLTYFPEDGIIRFGARSRAADSAQVITSATAYDLSLNRHFVLNIDYTAKAMQLYVDGILIRSLDSLSFGIDSFESSSGPLNYYGRFSSWASAFPFFGWLSKFGWWAKALTAGEVSFLYNSGVGRKYKELANFIKLEQFPQEIGFLNRPSVSQEKANPIILNARGHDGNGLLLRRRTFMGATDKGYFEMNSTFSDVIRGLVNKSLIDADISNRNIGGLSLGETTSDAPTISLRTRFHPMYELVRDLAIVSGLGFEIVKSDDEGIEFNVFQGADKTATATKRNVTFEATLPGVRRIEYLVDIEDWPTRWVVAGQGYANNRMVISGTDGEENTGINLHEHFVDARHIETPGGLNSRLDEAKNSRLPKEAVEIEIEDNDNALYRFGVDYGLGDIVTVKTPIGSYINLRVIAYEYIHQYGDHDVLKIILGKDTRDISQLLSGIWEEMKEKEQYEIQETHLDSGSNAYIEFPSGEVTYTLVRSHSYPGRLTKIVWNIEVAEQMESEGTTVEIKMYINSSLFLTSSRSGAGEKTENISPAAPIEIGDSIELEFSQKPYNTQGFDMSLYIEREENVMYRPEA